MSVLIVRSGHLPDVLTFEMVCESVTRGEKWRTQQLFATEDGHFHLSIIPGTYMYQELFFHALLVVFS